MPPETRWNSIQTLYWHLESLMNIGTFTVAWLGARLSCFLSVFFWKNRQRFTIADSLKSSPHLLHNLPHPMFSIGQDTSPIPYFSTLLRSTDGLSVTPRKNQSRIISLGDRLIVNTLFSLTPTRIAQHSPAHINNLYNTTFWALVQQGGQTTTEAHATLRVC